MGLRDAIGGFIEGLFKPKPPKDTGDYEPTNGNECTCTFQGQWRKLCPKCEAEKEMSKYS